MAAVGSIAQTLRSHTTIRALTLAWTSSADTHAVSGIASLPVDGELMSVTFVPGTGGVLPDDNYDVVIADENGFDILAGLGADLSQSTASRVTPLIGNGVDTNQRMPLTGTLELQVSNAGASKQGSVTLHFR